MNIHPIITPASPSLASPHFDVSFDSIESITTCFAAPVVPTLETTTVTEVALGDHRNQQYSITAMTTSTGAVAERYAYTAYGQPTIASASGTVLTSSAVGNRYTYPGREWDETLGLHHFRARWMSPLAGRFLGRDPMGYASARTNLNETFRCKPLHDLDPSGEMPPVMVAALAVLSCMTSTGIQALVFYEDDEYMRHCYASCIGAKRCSAPMSALAGFGFEAANLAWAQVVDGNASLHLPNSIYDLQNNAIGIACGGPVLPPGMIRCHLDFTMWLLGWGCADCCERFRR